MECFLTFSLFVIGCQPDKNRKKLLYTVVVVVGNPARGLLNRENITKELDHERDWPPPCKK